MADQATALAEEDALLVALHYHRELSYEDTRKYTRLSESRLLSLVRKLRAAGHLESVRKVSADAANKRRMLLKLTAEGARHAIFSLHRKKQASARTTFAYGINPWTGAKVRK